MDGCDYIVVGAGASGCVVASRLSENPDIRVLLLEAGGSNDVEAVRQPAQWPALLMGELDWAYWSTPQRHCNNRVIPLPRGKMLGGCASHNVNLWVRGHRSDFDSWAYQGCVGWDADSVMSVYERLEHYADAAASSGTDPRGTSGPMWIEQCRDPSPLATAFLDAGREVGLPVLHDHNSDQMEGIGYADVTIKDGLRHNVFNAYLKPAFSRANLTVETNAETHRLVLEQGRCVGVAYVQDGKPKTVRADREVIVSGGAYGSPRLLMLSGVGPADKLQSLGIDVAVDLSGVGRNLQDHVLLGGINYEYVGDPLPMTNSGVEAFFFWKSDSRLLAPDVQPVLTEFPFATPELTERIDGKMCYAIVPSLVRPASRGVVKLTSADPAAALHIDHNFLSCDADVRALTSALQLGREIGAADAFKPYRKRELMPGDTDAAGTLDFIRMSATTYFHPTSTCKMGVDEMSVVDPQLRVYGIDGLRVADASIMPDITSGNTNAPCVMIGERCAAMLMT